MGKGLIPYHYEAFLSHFLPILFFSERLFRHFLANSILICNFAHRNRKRQYNYERPEENLREALDEGCQTSSLRYVGSEWLCERYRWQHTIIRMDTYSNAIHYPRPLSLNRNRTCRG